MLLLLDLGFVSLIFAPFMVQTVTLGYHPEL